MRVALITDPPEEGWLSMDLCARELAESLRADYGQWRGDDPWDIHVVTPHLRRILSRQRWGSSQSRPPSRWSRATWNADRILGRHGYLPRFVRRQIRDIKPDIVHVTDHSYAQLLLNLPSSLTKVVTCYDLDAFRCLWMPQEDPRPWWYRHLMERVARGLRQADGVVTVSGTVREELLRYGLHSPENITVAYPGLYPECSPLPMASADHRVGEWAGPITVESDICDDFEQDKLLKPYIFLHVGSCIPRKRIDRLLEIFASLARRLSPREVVLLKVGGELDEQQLGLARTLGIADRIRQVPLLDTTRVEDRRVLAALYRRADLLLLTSSHEGFGLPVAEALACGTPVLVTDLPVLREIAGDVGAYAPLDNTALWIDQALPLLKTRRDPNLVEMRGRFAKRYSWVHHTYQIAAFYQRLLAAKTLTS